jgi:RNA polymerase sigma-70 factor (ECF subfamily)
VENQADAQDMVQECYIKLWQRRGEWWALQNPEGFSVVIIKNLCIDFLRKKRPDAVSVDTLQIAVGISQMQIELKEELEVIQTLVAQLPEKQKQVVVLKYWHDLPIEAIEKETGLKRGNIKMILSRTRKIIQKQYAKWEHQ